MPVPAFSRSKAIVAEHLMEHVRQFSILRFSYAQLTREIAGCHMMRKTIMAGAMMLALGSAAFAQSVTEKTGVNSVLGVAPTTADFVKQAAISDMTEIAAGKLGQERGNSEEKAFSGQMITDHTKTSNELKALVAGGVKAEIPAGLDDASEKKIGRLKDAKPEDFSSDFRSMQVTAHKNAVDLFERYAKGGEDPKLKDWAGNTLPHLQHHLEMAQALDKKK
jgi:putative membrane protein